MSKVAVRAVTSGRPNDYIPALDGFRAVSIGMVVFSHFGLGFFPGIFGVTIFFFISGFLITGNLLTEMDRTASINLPMFYVRRALRLYPALLVMVVFGAVAFWCIGARVTSADIGAAVFYMSNYWEMFGGFSFGSLNAPHVYGVLWSLAVEEHYYIVFPLFTLLLARRRGPFIAAMLVGVVAVSIWRWKVAAGCLPGGCYGYRAEHGTDTRIDSILFGAVFATLLASPWRTATLRSIGNLPAFVIGTLLLLVSLVIRDPWFRATLRFTVQGAGLFLVVGAILYGPSMGWARTVLSWRPGIIVGRLSYSLYLWHWIVLCLAVPLLSRKLSAPLVSHVPVSAHWLMWVASVVLPMTVLSLALAAASYHGIEMPMVAIRRRFGSHAVAEGGTASGSGGGAALERGRLPS